MECPMLKFYAMYCWIHRLSNNLLTAVIPDESRPVER